MLKKFRGIGIRSVIPSSSVDCPVPTTGLACAIRICPLCRRNCSAPPGAAETSLTRVVEINLGENQPTLQGENQPTLQGENRTLFTGAKSNPLYRGKIKPSLQELFFQPSLHISPPHTPHAGAAKCRTGCRSIGSARAMTHG